jgi:flagellin
LSSGQKITKSSDDPGGLAVSMKLNSVMNRLSGAISNVQNAISYLEVQDGALENVGGIMARMSELKALSAQDPMKNDQDKGKLQF